MMTPSASSASPSFGMLLRTAWNEFYKRFWRLAVLVLVFNAVMLTVQVSVFGTVAWQAFLEYLTAGGTASLGMVPLSRAYVGASLWMVVPVAIIMLFLQLWFLSALAVFVAGSSAETPGSLTALVRKGLRLLPHTFVIVAALFIFVRVCYFIIVLSTNLIYRYIGMTDGAVAYTNRVFLLVFAVVLMVAALIAGIALISAPYGSFRDSFRALRTAYRRFWSMPWDIGWRTGAAILVVYVIDQLAAQLIFSGIPLNPQALLSLFYLPFLLLFLHALLRTRLSINQ